MNINKPKYMDIFHLTSDIFNKSKAEVVLIGGFAVNHYKVARQTADMDFLITKEDYERIDDLLQKEGYTPYYTHEIFIRLKNIEPSFFDLDFMFIEKKTFEKIQKAGRKIEISGKKFSIPSLDHLIALKLHSIKYNPKNREFRDLPDIINLIRLNKVDYKSRSFRELCLKFGNEDLYSKILQQA
ncbi:MAG: hypothetical protein EHM45_10725 [Desulfobacteraceae bacterium]|nr:MAG: hypothetical protein EHM45_10725 [Desulfobacteraceae bacterium]